MQGSIFLGSGLVFLMTLLFLLIFRQGWAYCCALVLEWCCMSDSSRIGLKLTSGTSSEMSSKRLFEVFKQNITFENLKLQRFWFLNIEFFEPCLLPWPLPDVGGQKDIGSWLFYARPSVMKYEDRSSFLFTCYTVFIWPVVWILSPWKSELIS